MRPDVRGVLGIDVVQQVDQRAAADQDLVGAVAAVKQIGQVVQILAHQAQLLVQIAGQEFHLEGDAEFLFDLLVDLVVGIGLITRSTVEIGEGDGFFVGHSHGDQGDQQGQGQDRSQQLFHDSFLLVLIGHSVPFVRVIV